jgi:hypothetical protein
MQRAHASASASSFSYSTTQGGCAASARPRSTQCRPARRRATSSPRVRSRTWKVRRSLRRTFQGQAAALLPFPALVGRLGWLSRAALRARMLQHRLMPDGSPFGPGGARERAAALLAGSGAAAKVAATVATVAVIAGGTVVATSGQSHHAAPRRSRAVPTSAAPATQLSTTVSHPTAARLVSPTRPRRARARGRSAPGHAVTRHPRLRRATSASAQREPGGFAYLGVPTTSSAPVQPARTARASEGQSGGGPFSP